MASPEEVAALAARLTEWVERMSRDRTLPWAGLGILRDIEMATQLLTLREYGEWLLTNGPDEHRDFAKPILDIEDELDAAWSAAERALQNGVLPEGVPTNEPPRVIEALEIVAQQGAALRRELVEAGFLADDDTETDPAALLRALLA